MKIVSSAPRWVTYNEEVLLMMYYYNMLPRVENLKNSETFTKVQNPWERDQ